MFVTDICYLKLGTNDTTPSDFWFGCTGICFSPRRHSLLSCKTRPQILDLRLPESWEQVIKIGWVFRIGHVSFLFTGRHAFWLGYKTRQQALVWVFGSGFLHPLAVLCWFGAWLGGVKEIVTPELRYSALIQTLRAVEFSGLSSVVSARVHD